MLQALAAGVPLLCVPFFVDQFYIGEALSQSSRQIAGVRSLDINGITRIGDPETIFTALTELLEMEEGAKFVVNTFDE